MSVPVRLLDPSLHFADSVFTTPDSGPSASGYPELSFVTPPVLTRPVQQPPQRTCQLVCNCDRLASTWMVFYSTKKSASCQRLCLCQNRQPRWTQLHLHCCPNNRVTSRITSLSLASRLFHDTMQDHTSVSSSSNSLNSQTL